MYYYNYFLLIIYYLIYKMDNDLFNNSQNEDSDIDVNDNYDDDDFFNDKNKEYSVASSYPRCTPPNEDIIKMLE